MNPNDSAMIVADIFPPVAAVGVYRTVAVSQQLADEGWKVVVITAAPRADAFIDDAILNKVPASVRVIRTASPNLPLIAAKVLKRRPSAFRRGCAGVTRSLAGSAPKGGVLPRGPSIGCRGGCMFPIR